MKVLHSVILATLLTIIPTVICAENFALPDTQGKVQKLENYKGKWVLVNFWATWCPPCLREMPELIALHSAHKDKDLVVVSIAVDSGEEKKVTEFAKKLGVNFPIINWQWQKNAKMDQEITRVFGDVSAIPSSFLFTPKGEMVAQQRGGEISRADIETYITKKKP